MTDSSCTRSGYDDTGRYRVPVLDQCPECRGHGEHHPECDVSSDDIERVETSPVIPLDAQLALFEHRKWAVVARMRHELDQAWYLDELFALARRRLESGFTAYGSTMHGWDAATRIQNEMEEMADRLVYGTSEGVYV